MPTIPASTRLSLATVALAAVLGGAAPAGATPSIATEATPEEPGRTEIDLGYLVGGGDIGEQRRFLSGLHANIGRRFGDLVVLGEYDYFGVGHDGAGTMTRLGMVARYSLLRTSAMQADGGRSVLSGDFWLEAGAGWERVAWDVGGRLSRPDIAIGFGWQLDAVIGRREPRPRYYGPYVAFRALMARGPEPDQGTAICGGPCDTATRPSRNNVAMLLHFGVNWGR